MDDDGSNQTRLTSTVGFDAFPEWSLDGAAIAFTSNRAAVDDIWVMDADGGSPTRLTSGPKIDERPDWAPDGGRITFSRNGNIWVMDADGGNAVALTDTRRDEFAPTRAERPTDRVHQGGQRRPHRRLGDARRRHRAGAEDVRAHRLLPDWQPV